MAEWIDGPKMGLVADTCEAQKRLHSKAFGPRHGIRNLSTGMVDLDTIEEVFLLFGHPIDMPDLGSLDDFVTISHGAAVLVGHRSASIKWTVYPDGQRRIASDVLPLPVFWLGFNAAYVENAAHKILAAFGLVAWRHLHDAFPDADSDSFGEVWLDVAESGAYTVRDA